MGLFDGIEKLINEHGSAAILRERIQLANDQYAALEQKAAALQMQVKQLQAENVQLSQQLQQATRYTGNEFCDHCGGQNLKRAGARPNPTFGRAGVKDTIFECLDCNKQSFVKQK